MEFQFELKILIIDFDSQVGVAEGGFYSVPDFFVVILDLEFEFLPDSIDIDGCFNIGINYFFKS